MFWEDNIKIDDQEVGRAGMDWIDLARDMDRWWAPVNVVMNLRVPQNSENFLTSWRHGSFSGRILLLGVRHTVIDVSKRRIAFTFSIKHPLTGLLNTEEEGIAIRPVSQLIRRNVPDDLSLHVLFWDVRLLFCVSFREDSGSGVRYGRTVPLN